MLLRRTLLVNGIATAMTGLTTLLAAPWLPAVLGPASPLLLAVTGAGLVIFASVLLAQARRARIDRRVAWVIAALDIAWVLGSIAVMEVGVLTTIGNLVVGAIGAVVLVFAILELRGLSMMEPA